MPVHSCVKSERGRSFGPCRSARHVPGQRSRHPRSESKENFRAFLYYEKRRRDRTGTLADARIDYQTYGLAAAAKQRGTGEELDSFFGVLAGTASKELNSRLRELRARHGALMITGCQAPT